MSVDEKKNSKAEKKGGGQKGIIIVFIVIILILLGVVIALAVQSSKNANSGNNAKSESETETKRNVVVNEENVEEVIKDLSNEEVVQPGYYEVTMNGTWEFKDGKSTSDNAYVKNVVTNSNDVYFDVTLAETDELIYSSPVIPRGSYLENITLNKELSAGTYDCVCTYHLVDENQKTLSTLKIKLTIVIAE